MRLKKYLTCYIRQCRTGCFETFFANRMAPLEHLFDAHEHCDASWCWQKHLDDILNQHLQQLNNQGAHGEELVPPVDDGSETDDMMKDGRSQPVNDEMGDDEIIDEEYDAFENRVTSQLPHTQKRINGLERFKLRTKNENLFKNKESGSTCFVGGSH